MRRQQPAGGVLDDVRDRLVAWEDLTIGDALAAHRRARYLEGLRGVRCAGIRPQGAGARPAW